jgi:hypothetical protein
MMHGFEFDSLVRRFVAAWRKMFMSPHNKQVSLIICKSRCHMQTGAAVHSAVSNTSLHSRVADDSDIFSTFVQSDFWCSHDSFSRWSQPLSFRSYANDLCCERFSSEISIRSDYLEAVLHGVYWSEELCFLGTSELIIVIDELDFVTEVTSAVIHVECLLSFTDRYNINHSEIVHSDKCLLKLWNSS